MIPRDDNTQLAGFPSPDTPDTSPRQHSNSHAGTGTGNGAGAPAPAATGAVAPVSPPRMNTQQKSRLAWAILLVAFGVACVLFALTAYGVWRFRTTAMAAQGATLILRAPPEWVNWQRRAHTNFEQARDQQVLEEGHRVSIASSAGYGQATTLRLFDTSTIDMWAGADVTLERMQTSRWNNRRQEVVVRQRSGYVRYDLSDYRAYQDRTFQVIIGDSRASVLFATGGSYSIDIQPSDRRVLMTGDESYDSTTVDIAVRSGHALVTGAGEEVSLTPGERLSVDPIGKLSVPKAARWELIRDGAFEQYTEEEYNNTTIPDQPSLPRSQTWQVFSGPAGTGASGFFRLSHGCKPTHAGEECPPQDRRNAAWFIRDGDQTTSFTTGVLQKLGPKHEGVDISEYRSLVFSAWVRVFDQSVELAGDLGTECPIMIRFLVKEKQPTDPEEERVLCVYTSDDPAQQPVQAPGIAYYRAERYTWYHVQLDLRDPDWIPNARYLRSIEVYANGHDYDSRATEVSLIGSHMQMDVDETPVMLHAIDMDNGDGDSGDSDVLQQERE